MDSGADVIRNWINLAAAVVKDGEASNDEGFLCSRWCELLRDGVSMYREDIESRRRPEAPPIERGGI